MVFGQARASVRTRSTARSQAEISAKPERFKLRKETFSLVAGEKAAVRLKPKSASKLTRLIRRRGAKASATVKVRATAPRRDLELTKLKIRLIG